MTRPLTAVGVITTLVVAIGFPSIEAVLGLMGATCSVSLSFFTPALLYRRFVLGRLPSVSVSSNRAGHLAVRPLCHAPATPGHLTGGGRPMDLLLVIFTRQVRGLIFFGLAIAAVSIPQQLGELVRAVSSPGAAHDPNVVIDTIALQHHAATN